MRPVPTTVITTAISQLSLDASFENVTKPYTNFPMFACKCAKIASLRFHVYLTLQKSQQEYGRSWALSRALNRARTMTKMLRWTGHLLECGRWQKFSTVVSVRSVRMSMAQNWLAVQSCANSLLNHVRYGPFHFRRDAYYHMRKTRIKSTKGRTD